MKRILKVLVTLSMIMFVVTGIMIPVSCQAATGISQATYYERLTAFTMDSRWKDYASYGAISPKLSSYQSNGCCAYAADFCQYVYGVNSWNYPQYFTQFTSASEIREGDIIYLPESSGTSQHWFVVLECEGNGIRSAEGNVSGTYARISRNHYTISNGQLYDSWNNKMRSIGVGYHYNFYYPTPGKPVLNVNAGIEDQAVKFSWNATTNTVNYDIRIYKQGNTEPEQIIWGVQGTSYSCKLPAGDYYATIASVYNAYSCTFGDRVDFNVKKKDTHVHSYKTKIKKATVSSNGYIQKKCSCGKISSKSTIYYPKTITLSKSIYTYDGKTKKPSVKVVGSNGKTISSKNYTVTYSGNRKKPGTYKVSIKFSGNYSGTVTKTFKILEKNHKHNYKKTVVKATTTKNGYTQYKCSCGRISKKTTIYYPKKVKLSETTYIYDGNKKTPSVKVTGSNGKTISKSNYSVSYQMGRKKAGTYKVTVKFKGNYSGSVVKTFKIYPKTKKWIYVDKLPSGVSSSKFDIQYKHTYKKTTSSYVNDGNVYESLQELPTSSTRVFVGCYYYHFCGGSTGQVVNYTQTDKYVHYDSVPGNSVTVVSSGLDGDGNINYYLLNWKGTTNPVWCSSGTTCDGAYGSHGARGKAWYRMNQYQNKKLVNKTITIESDWTTKKDSKAVKTTYRYRAK